MDFFWGIRLESSDGIPEKILKKFLEDFTSNVVENILGKIFEKFLGISEFWNTFRKLRIMEKFVCYAPAVLPVEISI